VPHSWHDFDAYWRESSLLQDLRDRHAENLRSLQGSVFRSDPVALVRDRTLPWTVGARLLQLASWRSIVSEYRLSPRLPRAEPVTVSNV
jgi:hypothetical protein